MAASRGEAWPEPVTNDPVGVALEALLPAWSAPDVVSALAVCAAVPAVAPRTHEVRLAARVVMALRR